MRVEVGHSDGYMQEGQAREEHLLGLLEVCRIAVGDVKGKAAQAAGAGEDALVAVEHLVAVAG